MNALPAPTKKRPAYMNRLSPERAAALYARILQTVKKNRYHRDPLFTATRLAAELHTNTRYISVAVAACTGSNFCGMMNALRMHAACRMLRSEKHAALTLEEIALHAGFSSRQVFYKVFQQTYGCTPREYRMRSSIQ